jgi:hypothetical protein
MHHVRLEMQLNYKVGISLTVLWIVVLVFIVSYFYPSDLDNFISNFFFERKSYEVTQSGTMAGIIIVIGIKFLNTTLSLVIPIAAIWGTYFKQHRREK